MQRKQAPKRILRCGFCGKYFPSTYRGIIPHCYQCRQVVKLTIVCTIYGSRLERETYTDVYSLRINQLSETARRALQNLDGRVLVVQDVYLDQQEYTCYRKDPGLTLDTIMFYRRFQCQYPTQGLYGDVIQHRICCTVYVHAEQKFTHQQQLSKHSDGWYVTEFRSEKILHRQADGTLCWMDLPRIK